MDQKEAELFQRVGEVFMRFGIKAVTMDDIAKELSVSKKTLYKYVKDKGDLVNKVMELKCVAEESLLTQFAEEAENAIEEIIMISKYVSAQLQMVHPSLHYDLSRYYSKAFKTFVHHKENVISAFVARNLERGIKEGFYRDNLNPKIIAKLHIHKIDALFNPDVFAPGEISFLEAHSEMMKYHIRGVASEKGVAYLKNKLKTETINIL